MDFSPPLLIHLLGILLRWKSNQFPIPPNPQKTREFFPAEYSNILRNFRDSVSDLDISEEEEIDEVGWENEEVRKWNQLGQQLLQAINNADSYTYKQAKLHSFFFLTPKKKRS